MAMAGQVALAIVIGLLIGSVLGLLIWKAWMVRHRKALRLAEQERSVAQYTHILDSLEVLCRAVEQKQVELSEAAIRAVRLVQVAEVGQLNAATDKRVFPVVHTHHEVIQLLGSPEFGMATSLCVISLKACCLPSACGGFQ